MHYISRIFAIAAVAFVAQTADAQPPARKGENKKESGKTTEAKKASAKANAAPSKPSASKTSVSVKPGDLKSSGIEVPALYID